MTLLAVFFLLGVVIITVQTTLFSIFPEGLGKPDFLYILVVFAAYRFSWFHGLFLAFVFGWMMDVVSGIHLGVFPLQNILVFSVLKLLTENSPLKESTYQVPLVGISYFVVQMGFYFFYSLTLPGTLPVWSWSRIAQETAVLLLVTIPAFFLFNMLHDYLSVKRVVHRVVRRKTGNQFR